LIIITFNNKSSPVILDSNGCNTKKLHYFLSPERA